MDGDLQARLAALEAENSALRALHEQGGSQNKHHINTSPAVCRISIKLPPLWPDRVTVWFAQAEAQFHLAGITTDDTKYSHVLSQIDHKIAGEIEDIVVNPPAEGKYEKLKQTLISRFSSSEEQRVRRLLSDEELGDRKPSQFLRHLRSLAGTTLSDDNILRQLWLRRLPQHVQGILAAQADLGLDRIADIADKILEAQPGPANICSASSPSPMSIMMERIEELSRQVAALSAQSSGRSRDRSARSSGPTSRSATPDRAAKRCWYHRKYGAKASKCVSPCDWKTGNLVSRQ